MSTSYIQKPEFLGVYKRDITKSLEVKVNLWGGDIHDLNGMEFGNDVGATFLREISHALRADNHWRY